MNNNDLYTNISYDGRKYRISCLNLYYLEKIMIKDENKIWLSSQIRFRLILRSGSIYSAFLFIRFRFVWKYDEGRTIFEI